MPDIRKCAVCRVEFDFDESGLEGPNDVVVCGAVCAKKSAASRGSEYVIHDGEGAVVETNITPGIKTHRW
ncbi:MAG: hypothetical protein UW46_C0006G0011 [Candidatus Yanofskybacteria bacterium GW2011_GWF1_44_227]|uniref:Uncharacterized protein n=1 Tax=Candidatus Yanofskybacteria bacterium GW2011_GWE2_40_11 TaxID=1619033 RepID=A0A0G0T1P4_9BACT|nr:MAG: hypothetical protein UT69_C0002G0006 [Candidatus Yanofskybacteria bacterium GW2011_GWE1_40_10]KKR41025.1 MAG: hypothetical protein UT75_C0002G0062 [Candidatus Yanofskybacteria bacterium GW2011_GWE2_40_11]KKT15474.1 MAG: hypothetical protein UV97_C0006G0041 [Candidatus Yanofskybacteria bacterium GW2011_GWF2_43_596]KKT53110.1 MAG: hypothetical protein UW46_C0006G0011 [Candidatus Yanofskybacteria bacterium GW2011_GWF1_44_227]OGN35538.1 MAG: hypothetical protein A2207_02240 [Candidatus Yano